MKKTTRKLIIFGEVLFDCFEDGQNILGGAPFNIAWHCQAFGDEPQFISSVGDDALGQSILDAAQLWGLDTQNIQVTPDYPTGQVAVTLVDNEPHYQITPEVAYDHIQSPKLIPEGSLLYHGSLALRHPASRATFEALCQTPNLKRFVDVNLRSPWWQKSDIDHWCQGATWVKLNVDELRLLGFDQPNLQEAMSQCLSQYGLTQLIVTRGAEGAMVLQADGQVFSHQPQAIAQFVDTVGAGDAFTAVYLHGLLANWPVERILQTAQTFAGQVIGLRGATTTDQAFYTPFLHALRNSALN
ncbi:carbohydrate kinase family protein [Thiosulfativibrio zosterae]|uniref:Fructokinase n=1 Tax=Thiosulfativibrio zosterae TaxID=2675053 RepID=A0A6F8PR23_9GAMM|nr:carbohydrate kinase [Thiosulfativibrio zosterae]BBP44478.1 fructokinase [Thiosulfativibrio zosterae]